ncbi:hypothetical protein [Enterovirga rhinocerotis]|uniref:hypothetical protein n=1 Tax=Enterovirga rhinocerotis TaxID=1339210 RepID=UPI001414E277|nr:hypothetical protein [Enterovirga rhinocerotis]
MATSARPEARLRLGSLLAEIGREARLTDADWAAFDAATARDRTPDEPIAFE